MYSALKKNGKKLYELAREGKTIDRPPREVQVHSISLTGHDSTDVASHLALPEFGLEVEVSGGTYIRTLIADIGAHCGTCAHMTGLLRTRVGPFRLEHCIHNHQWENEGDIFAHVDYCSTLLPDVNIT